MEQEMNKQQIITETIKVLGHIELPMVQKQVIDAIQGSIQNLHIVLMMMDAEEKAKQEEKNGHTDAE